MLLINKKETQEHQRTLRQNKYTLKQACHLGKMIKNTNLLDDSGYIQAGFVDKEGSIRYFSGEALLFSVYLSILREDHVFEKSLTFEQQLILNKSLQEAVDKLNLHAPEDGLTTYIVRDIFVFSTVSHLYKLTKLIRRSVILSWLILAQIIYSLYKIIVFNYHTAALALLDTAAWFDENGATHYFIKNITPFSFLIIYIATAIIAAIAFILLRRNLAPVIRQRNNFFVLFTHIPEQEILDAFDRIIKALASKADLNEEILT